MNCNVYITIMLVVGCLLSSCSRHSSDQQEAVKLEDNSLETTGPYLSINNEHQPVLCWMAKTDSASSYMLKYAVLDTNTGKLGKVVSIASSKGASYAAESPGKVAFKSDGTAFAVFAKRFESEQNPFAGAIYYSHSVDNGQSWSEARFLHSDTSHAYGRNFFDVATLQNGEVAAIWLDGRFGRSQKGSALFFAGTEGEKFGKDSCLNKSTCECCRTDLHVAKNGKLHIAYRSIQFPSSQMGAQVRDMVYICSTDNGKTFSSEENISADNWRTEGCPHSGPSLAASGNQINAVWFTAAGGSPGLYLAGKKDGQAAFAKRHFVDASGRHPQITSVGSKMLIVCEESVQGKSDHSHQHNQKDQGHAEVTNASIKLIEIAATGETKITKVTDGSYADHHAVLTTFGKKLLIAWIRDEQGKSSIYYTIRSIQDEQ